VLIFTLEEEGYSTGVEEGVTLLLASDPGTLLEDQRLTIPGVGVAILAIQ
jgi:hypothetical protein